MNKEAYNNNPFRINGIIERPIYPKEDPRQKIDFETGELETWYRGAKVKIVLHDSKMYTKLFADSQEIIKKLTPAATKLFQYIALKLKPNHDLIYLVNTDTCVWCEFSESSFRRSIVELIENKIIAKKLGSHLEYWINTNILYNGDRVRKFKSYKQNPQANEEV